MTQYLVITLTSTAVTFRPEWAVNSNQTAGPWAPQPETH